MKVNAPERMDDLEVGQLNGLFCRGVNGASLITRIGSALMKAWQMDEYRKFYMSQGFVLLGDLTTHGGVVISASSTHIVEGKRAALVGDLVFCPLPFHGVNPIMMGCEDWSEDGRAIVVNGCLCACGCAVISSAPDCAVG